MTFELEESYFTWLYHQVASLRIKNPSKTYWSLARQLFTTEFVWFIPNDDNRVEDGRDLRHEFLAEAEIEEVDPEWMRQGCSMLEMLIGLSRRLSFEDDGTPRDWFWKLIENLDLERCTDRNYDHIHKAEIEETLNHVIFRTYAPNGHGGLFPLRHAQEDQTNVELWYQLSAYLLENS